MKHSSAPTPHPIISYEMIYNAGQSRVVSATPAGLLEALIPGYQTLPDEEQFESRLRLAHHVLEVTQVNINLNATPDQMQPPVRDIITRPSNQPVTLPIWLHDVPLVVIDAHYTPFTPLHRPEALGAGVLVWINTETEEKFLSSLHSAKYIKYVRSHG